VAFGAVGMLSEGLAGLLPKNPSGGASARELEEIPWKLNGLGDEEDPSMNGGRAVGGGGVNVVFLGCSTTGVVEAKDVGPDDPEDGTTAEGSGGGVLGLDGSSFENFTASTFVGAGQRPNAGFGAAGWGFVASGFSVLYSLTTAVSSSRESGVVARGELREGRVLGRPSPIPKGEVDEVAMGDGVVLGDFDDTGADDGSLTGDPGGVVLSWRTGTGVSVSGRDLGRSEGVIVIDGASGLGVAD
jgi:hypothetical protein